MFLLDTDVVSSVIRHSPPAALMQRVAAVPSDQQLISSITVGELIYGAHRNVNRTEILLNQIEATLLSNLTILPFDEYAARRYGELRALLERRGTPIGDSDTRIAAIALDRDLTVVTGNVRHFERVPGLRVENWL